ncbi:MAG: hypothetical protein QOG64_477 [Acidimicrobiaceae bacterium]|nr:hypothetical protein [Acidimicrobiaceae bacterium]
MPETDATLRPSVAPTGLVDGPASAPQWAEPAPATEEQDRDRLVAGSARRAGERPVNVLHVVRPLLTATRWGTLAVGFAVSASSHREAGELTWGLVLAAYALIRTFWPLTYREGRQQDLAAVLGEVFLMMAVVTATGYWSSPYFFCLATAVIAAGFARGFRFATTASIAAAAAVAIPFHLRTPGASARLTVLGTSELLLIAVVTGYARRLFGEAEARTSLALDRLTRLTEANGLLQELHHLAQDLPATLDLKETVSSTTKRLRQLLEADVIALFLYEPVTSAWTVATCEGTRLDGPVAERALPPGLVRVARERRVILVDDLSEAGQRGLSEQSGCGLYVPLNARGALIGLLGIESRHPGRFTIRDAGLVEGLAEQAALALDNARWFAKLRTVGADEERTRIARDLHDRVGQSLAYLAFELERIGGRAEDPAIRNDLSHLRNDVRQVVSEVRDTLYDLRTDVSETQDLVATVDSFLHRVRQRTNLRVIFRSAAGRRLPLPQERELWRIAQEAVTNAERHAGAATVTVSWRCDEGGAALEVADDGRGFHGQARPDAYGLVGMRERADSIGAILTVESAPGRGTTVRCILPVR